MVILARSLIVGYTGAIATAMVLVGLGYGIWLAIAVGWIGGAVLSLAIVSIAVYGFGQSVDQPAQDVDRASSQDEYAAWERDLMRDVFDKDLADDIAAQNQANAKRSA